MKRFLFFFYSIFVLTSYSVAENDSTLVIFEDLSFSSATEKEAFRNRKDTSSRNLFFLYSVISEKNDGYLSTKFDEILSFTKEYKTGRFAKRRKKRQIKILYKDAHKKFLDQYKQNAYYPDIFSKGEYNCLTASMLYAQIFKILNIPFEIKLALNHVYLVAYPKSESIKVETTRPSDGYEIFNSHFKRKYISHLVDNKIISDKEYKTKSIDELFNEYYFKEKNINLVELAGLQYFNRAISHMKVKEFKKAFPDMEKAYYLNRSEQPRFMLNILNLQVLNETERTSPGYIEYLCKYTRHDEGNKKDLILEEFGILTNEYLINRYDCDQYENLYHKLRDNISEKEICNEIDFYYNYERARVLYNKGEYKEAYPYIKDAYKANSRNVDCKQLLVSIIGNKISKTPTGKPMLDSLKHYLNNFKFLEKNDMFIKLKLNNYLFLMYQNFLKNNPELANKYKDKFEYNYLSKDYPSLYRIIGAAYGSGGKYYFKKGRYSKAKSIIKTGLEYVPNSIELQSRLRALQ